MSYSPFLIGLSVAVSAIAVPVAASAGGSMGQLKGTIIVSDAQIPASFDSDQELVTAMKKAKRTAIKGSDGSWTLHLMAFLKKAAGASKVNLVYYDVTKKREQVHFTEIDVQANQSTIQLNDQAVTKELGFVAGHKYQVLITRLVGGKEDVYAKAVVTLN